jgi:hypothetical protein
MVHQACRRDWKHELFEHVADDNVGDLKPLFTANDDAEGASLEMAALSVAVTVLSVFAMWLVLPVFVLPPLAFYLGYRAYKARRVERRGLSGLQNVLALAPMTLAFAAFLLEVYALNAGYRA